MIFRGLTNTLAAMAKRGVNAFLALREELGLTQTELAKRVGSNQPRICAIENGEGVSKEMALALWDEFEKVLGRLGFTLPDILRGASRVPRFSKRRCA